MKFTKMILAFLLALSSVQVSAKSETACTKLVVGAPAPAVLSTYYAAKVQSVSAVESKLKANGFSILAKTAPIKGSTVITVTNKELKKIYLSEFIMINYHLHREKESSYMASGDLRVSRSQFVPLSI